jgi:hypothetical protein
LKRLILCILLAFCFAGWTWDSAQAATPRSVYIVDRSELIPTEQLTNALPAFQAAVSEDFAPVWGQDAKLIVSNTPPAGAWRVIVSDYSDMMGALGYHGVTGNVAYSKVFAASTVNNGESWQGCLTHELFEMLADPYINRMAFSNRMWLVEVADPVEADAYNYARHGADGSLVPISDFVTPSWYIPHSRAPFDFARHARKPLRLLPGGYVSYWDVGWHQIFA